MYRKFLLVSCLFFSFTACLLWIATRVSAAQLIDTDWSAPQLLSSPETDANTPAVLSDDYGVFHLVWPEKNLVDQTVSLRYAQYDGAQWSQTISVASSGPGAEFRSPQLTMDQQGNLHLIWMGTKKGPVFYMTAPQHSVLNADEWTKPEVFDFPAYEAYLSVDQSGSLNLTYSIYSGDHLGVFHSQRHPATQEWADPQAIDLQPPPGYSIPKLSVAATDNKQIHAVWWYRHPNGEQETSSDIRYANSGDGGITWSVPIILDQASQQPKNSLLFATPSIAVSEEHVLVVWAGGERPNRRYAISSDAGKSWSAAAFIESFGELHGQAEGDSLAVDGGGNVHFLSDIRYPQGLYHAVWNPTGWSNPELVYQVKTESDGRSAPGSIHVHRPRSAFRAGNQLMAVFLNSHRDPERQLFVMEKTFADLNSTVLLSTPTISPKSTSTSAPPTQLPPANHPTQADDTDSTSTLIVAAVLFGAALILVSAVLLWKNRKQ